MIFSEDRFPLLGITLYCAANVFTKIENALYAASGMTTRAAPCPRAIEFGLIQIAGFASANHRPCSL